MNEEKRSICDAIFSAIQDDIRNLCDTEIFTQSTFMELGEFFLWEANKFRGGSNGRFNKYSCFSTQQEF